MKSDSGINKREEFNFWGQWLKKNYEVAEGESVARKALYEQYLEQCRETKKKPMSSALLGVIVNATFRNLGMKRLGSRGKSEYYYCGMRLKKSSLKKQEKAGKVQAEPVVNTRTKWRQWLLDNYEVSPGLSMPRSAVYDQLQWHSHQNKLEPISSSSLGKLLNSVFPGVLARRLGTRGNSEYHYWGLHLKQGSPLRQLRENSEAGDREMEDNSEGSSQENKEEEDGSEGCDETTKDDSEGSSRENKEQEIESDIDVETVKEKTRGSRGSRKKSGSRTSRK